MTGPAGAATAGCVVDTMVLAMFVDADRLDLLTALADGAMFVPPSVADPDESPLFAERPIAEFAMGAAYLEQRSAKPFDAVRFNRRMAFYAAVGTAWQPVALSAAELRLAVALADPAMWRRAAAIDPAVRVRRIGRGEAECAAVAVARDLTLWSDDAAIVNLLAALHPGHPVERISDLLIRAAREGLLGCQEAADLYNDVFRNTLGLWTRIRLVCDRGEVAAR